MEFLVGMSMALSAVSICIAALAYALAAKAAPRRPAAGPADPEATSTQTGVSKGLNQASVDGIRHALAAQGASDSDIQYALRQVEELHGFAEGVR